MFSEICWAGDSYTINDHLHSFTNKVFLLGEASINQAVGERTSMVPITARYSMGSCCWNLNHSTWNLRSCGFCHKWLTAKNWETRKYGD